MKDIDENGAISKAFNSLGLLDETMEQVIVQTQSGWRGFVACDFRKHPVQTAAMRRDWLGRAANDSAGEIH
ncbi:MAG: hypothetical protein M2R45_01063 [Verrucomicrobia subdivision 3 bacterium]|nr:hypothetical protein [Limisphaerales bacterium]